MHRHAGDAPPVQQHVGGAGVRIVHVNVGGVGEHASPHPVRHQVLVALVQDDRVGVKNWKLVAANGGTPKKQRVANAVQDNDGIGDDPAPERCKGGIGDTGMHGRWGMANRGCRGRRGENVPVEGP